MLHKRHPGNIIKSYAMKQVLNDSTETRFIKQGSVYMNTLKYKGYRFYCKEEGIEPHKSYSSSLNIRISPEVHSKIAIFAKQAGISINAFIKSAVGKQVATLLQ